MKLIVISIFYISQSLFSQCTNWEQQAFPNRGTIHGIQFFDANTGYIVSAGGQQFGNWNFIKTTNGGTTWIDVGSGLYQVLEDLSFLNKDTGYVGGLNYLGRTYNGGLNWTRININGSNPLASYERVKFFNIDTGIIFGSGVANILKTTNGGLNWTPLLNINNPYFCDDGMFTVLNKDTILIGGGRTYQLGFVSVTFNGGLDWTLVDSLSSDVTDMSFLDNKNGILCGPVGNYFFTTNTGLTWTRKQTNYNISFSKVKYLDSNSFFFVDYGGNLYYTTNKGQNWGLQNCFNFTPGAPGRIFFTNQYTGWVGGGFGNYTSGLFKTTNGGLTYIEPSLNTVPNSFELSANYPNPFNPTTSINFSIPITGLIKITVYDINGKEIQVLVNQELRAGTYSTQFEGVNLPSGVYFYKLQVGSLSISRKMILCR